MLLPTPTADNTMTISYGLIASKLKTQTKDRPCLFLEDLFRFQVTTAPLVAADAKMCSESENICT